MERPDIEFIVISDDENDDQTIFSDDIEMSTTKNYVSNARTWNNKLFKGDKSMDDFSWVLNEHKKIASYIGKYPVINTRKTHLIALTAFLKQMVQSGIKQAEAPYQMYSDLSTKLAKDVLNEYKEQKMDDGFVNLDDIVRLRNELRALVMANKANHRLHMVWLTVAMNTMAPPMRSQIYKMPFEAKKRAKADKTNYLYPDVQGLWHMRVYNKQKGRVNDNDDKLSPALSKEITISREMYPRKFLISNWDDPSQPMDYKTMYLELSKLKPKVGENTFRHAYVTHEWDKNPSLLEKEALAKRMLHDVKTSESMYYKRRPAQVEQKEEKEERVERRVHPPPPPRPVGQEPFRGLSANALVPARPPKPAQPVVQQAPAVVDVAERRRLKNLEAKKRYRDKNKAILVAKQKAYLAGNEFAKEKQRARAYVRKLNLDEKEMRIKNPGQLDRYEITRREDGCADSGLMEIGIRKKNCV